MASTPLVMVTGGNGFIGYAVIVGSLQAGYHVRAAVRRQDGIDTISRGPSIQKYLADGSLTFALVPDNTKAGAYREAAKDCSYIMHIASPLATQEGDLVSQATAGNKAILDAAEATPSVKRVVFTASIASIRGFDRMISQHPDNEAIKAGKGDQVQTLTAETRIPTPPPTSNDTPGFLRYCNSKIGATNLIHEYAATHGSESRFSIVNLMPGWVLGPEELSRNKREAFKGSNLLFSWLFSDFNVLAMFLGLPADTETPLLSETVHLDDVAESHVKALDIDKVPGSYRNFLLCSNSPTGPVIMDAADIVRKELPQEVADGKIPITGKLGMLLFLLESYIVKDEAADFLGTIESKFDATPTERDLLGHPFKPYSEQVVDTVRWYAHLED